MSIVLTYKDTFYDGLDDLDVHYSDAVEVVVEREKFKARWMMEGNGRKVSVRSVEPVYLPCFEAFSFSMIMGSGDGGVEKRIERGG